jgi:hydroxypyruvate reductase
MLSAGLEAAEPARLVARHLRRRGRALEVGGVVHRLDRGRLALVAAGKAASAMARAAEQALGGASFEAVAVDSSAGAPLARTRLLLARHPVPDERGLKAALEVEALARGLGRGDLLVLLLSGGASALLPAPAEGIGLDDKAAVTTLLMRAGATIHELNTVRKHLSRLKGGGLARAAAPARVAALVLSDVVGDDLATIASGPAVPDPTTFADAVEVLRRRGVLETAPAAVRERLEQGARGALPETPKPGDPVFARVSHAIVGSNRLSLEAAAREGRRQGLRPVVLTSRLQGEAREAARVLVAVLRDGAASVRSRRPACLLAGGETTVTVEGQGRGGRNQELVTAAAEPLADFRAPAVVASLATDGIDGHSDAAGGGVDDRTLARAEALGLAAPSTFLADNDSERFLAPLGDLIVTGPTGTNVVDLTVLLAAPEPVAHATRRRRGASRRRGRGVRLARAARRCV